LVLKNSKEKRTCTILALFVVDPDKRIISTKDIPILNWTKEEINHHLRFMFHQKYFVTQFNKEVFERNIRYANINITTNLILKLII
jgi:hypothetical protein